jgi:hypothetical protein
MEQTFVSKKILKYFKNYTPDKQIGPVVGFYGHGSERDLRFSGGEVTSRRLLGCGALKLWCPATTLHGDTTQKTSDLNGNELFGFHKKWGISCLAE